MKLLHWFGCAVVIVLALFVSPLVMVLPAAWWLMNALLPPSMAQRKR